MSTRVPADGSLAQGRRRLRPRSNVTSTLLGTLAYWQNRLPHQGATPAGYLHTILTLRRL